MYTSSLMLYLFFLVHSPATEILIPGEKIIGRPVRAGVPIIENGVFLRPQDFVIIKGLIENSSSVCEVVIDEALKLNEHSLRRAHQECDAQQIDNRDLIEMLSYERKQLKEKLIKSETKSEITKYIAIGLGAVALSSTAYIIVK